MQSLREKLLKAGLVTEEAAKKAETEKAARPAPAERPARSDAPRRDDRRDDRRDARPERPARFDRPARSDAGRPPPRHDPRPPPRHEPRVEARLPRLPPLQGTKEANRLAAKAQLELDRKLREMVVHTQVPQEPGTTTFYFVTRKQKLRRLELSEAQAKLLQEGQLAVVERPDPDKIDHALVPAEVAKAMKAMSERAVRFFADGTEKVGFLTDEEISRRASEADEQDEAPATAASAEAPTAASTFITIKRAPLPT